ncbi:MAG: hypothetical protein LAP87_21150 [Acidobacteriia bacterium]|nr:hypothetical protein [Terriglobia bacterium]
MSITKRMKPGQQSEGSLAEAEVASATDAHTPPKLTFAENVIVTIKILVAFALVGVALWAVDFWTSTK